MGPVQRGGGVNVVIKGCRGAGGGRISVSNSKTLLARPHDPAGDAQKIFDVLWSQVPWKTVEELYVKLRDELGYGEGGEK